MYNTIKDLEAAGIVKKDESVVEPSKDNSPKTPKKAPKKAKDPVTDMVWDRFTIGLFVAVNAFWAFVYIGLPIVLAK